MLLAKRMHFEKARQARRILDRLAGEALREFLFARPADDPSDDQRDLVELCQAVTLAHQILDRRHREKIAATPVPPRLSEINPGRGLINPNFTGD